MGRFRKMTIPMALGLWIMASGNAVENWSASINSSLSSPFVSVSLDGSVRGLSEYTPSGYHVQERNDPNSEKYGVRTGFENAQLNIMKYLTLVNMDLFQIYLKGRTI